MFLHPNHVLETPKGEEVVEGGSVARKVGVPRAMVRRQGEP